MKAPVRIVTLALTTVVVLLSTTSAALADSPVGSAWPAGQGRSTLEWLLLFGGSTVALFAGLWIFALLTARNNYEPPPPSTDLEHVPSNSLGDH